MLGGWARNDGVLPRRVVDQAVDYAGANLDVEVLVAGDTLAGLVVERYLEALHGDIRMNCDTCAYRVLLPGLEDKRRTPHHHPDDPTGHGHGHGHAHGRTV